MALTLKYRNGFIDAEDETVSGPAALQRRASSLPPRMSKMVQVEEFLQEEETYVQKLSERLSSPLDRSPLASGPTTETQEMLSGSVGHPELCWRPCLFLMAGNCENGAACAFCHLPHENKGGKPNKKQRDFMQSLSHSQFFNLISALCRERAMLLNITQEAGEVLKILQAEATFSSFFGQLLPLEFLLPMPY
ncbi:unnamed protein product [Durusdinium trenchii]|uniref:C3H1-type domain-containing protein n=1 Tax=Durusdinium trenchii TaxID=1381693 RepID=A0ABP0I0U7_9DINO